MDPFSLIEDVWWAGIPIALAFGGLLALNPFALPLLGSAVGMGAAGAVADRNRAVSIVAAFGAGMVVVYTVIGVLAASIDDVIETVLAPWAGWAYLALGVVLLAFGTVLLLRPAAFCLACTKPKLKSPTLLGAFLAGLPAGLANCPACAGIVAAVAASAATAGNVTYSTTVMFSFGAGHALVLVLLAWFLVGRWSLTPKALRVFRPVAATVLLAAGAYVLWIATQWGLGTGPRLI